jgi:hypothetical protein
MLKKMSRSNRNKPLYKPESWFKKSQKSIRRAKLKMDIIENPEQEIPLLFKKTDVWDVN